MASDDRTAPARHLLFALNMLVGTADGDVFTPAEFREWMRAAGLSFVRRLDVGVDGPGVIVLAANVDKDEKLDEPSEANNIKIVTTK